MYDSFIGVLLHDDLDCGEEREEFLGIDDGVEVLVDEGVEDMLHEFVELGVFGGVILSCEVLQNLIEIFGGGFPMFHVQT